MKILPYTDLMSHPNKKLENHLKNVADFSYDVFNFLEIENKELFSNISFLIGLTHDFAKSTSFFQTYLSDHTKKKILNIVFYQLFLHIMLLKII